MRKFKSLQGLRAVAFINIFLLHMSTWGVRYIISSATWAVSFFFILSGFLYGCREKNEPKIESWKPDLKKTFHRINKLYPLYVVSLLMLIPISGLAQSVISQDWIQVKYILFGWYLKDILLVQSWIPVDYYCLNGAAWYLSTLVFLLLCLNPILYFYKRGGVKRLKLSVYAAPVVTLLWTLACALARCNLQFWAYIFPPFRLIEFMAGIALGMLHQNKRSDDGTLREVIICGIIFGCMVFIRLTHIEVLDRDVLWILPNIALIEIFSQENGKISKLLQSRFFQFAGAISGECFIMHQSIIRYMDYYLSGMSGSILINLCVLIVTFWLVIVISYLAKKVNGLVIRNK